MSQEQLANESEISLAQITRIEHGKVNPTICTIKAMSQGLKVKAFELLDF